jgi:hypothetical protein
MAPAWGFRLLVERLHEEAEAVVGDEGRNFAALIELSMRRSAGKISEAEYAAEEAALLQRLSDIRDAREEWLAPEEEWDEAVDDGDDAAVDAPDTDAAEPVEAAC